MSSTRGPVSTRFHQPLPNHLAGGSGSSFVRKAMPHTQENQSRASDLLGISQATLQGKLLSGGR